MKTSSLLSRAALAALAVVSVMLLGARDAEAARGRGSFGAIAYSASTGRSGWSASHGTKNAALRAAINSCGEADCRAEVWLQGSCGAAVRGKNGISTSWGYPDRRGAEWRALAECSIGSSECVLVAWACSRD